MYNRYIPQKDGGYQKRPMPEPAPPPRPVPPPAHVSPPPPSQKPPFGIGSFLRQLLPGEFDAEDLLVVILLLLITGNENGNRALLTLVIYLFL